MPSNEDVVLSPEEFSLDDIPDVHLLEAGKEAELRLLDVYAKNSQAGVTYLQIRLESVADDLAKDIYAPVYMPSSDKSRKQNAGTLRRIKGILQAFGAKDTGVYSQITVFEALKAAKGNRCYCLIGLQEAKGGYEASNTIERYGTSAGASEAAPF